jgi:hypothetical protein
MERGLGGFLSAFICSICVICVLFWDGTLMTLIGRMVADFFDVDNLAVIGMVTEFYLRLSARSASSVFYSGMERG